MITLEYLHSAFLMSSRCIRIGPHLQHCIHACQHPLLFSAANHCCCACLCMCRTGGREVVVNRYAGEAVLQGSNVYAPGLLAASSGLAAGDMVAVTVAVEQQAG